VDIELSTENVKEIIAGLKSRAGFLVSYHDMAGTPSLGSLQDIVRRQRDAGADICKVVTTAQKFADNLTVLRLIKGAPGVRMVVFAMGPLGAVSRVLCPLAGGDFVYASVGEGMEAASGQITVAVLRNIYDMVQQ
jgi:3-dehydroquinate dehydratase-1